MEEKISLNIEELEERIAPHTDLGEVSGVSQSRVLFFTECEFWDGEGCTREGINDILIAKIGKGIDMPDAAEGGLRTAAGLPSA